MKHFLFCFFKAFFCFTFLIFLAQAIVSAQEASAFPVGEKLTYNISFASFPDAGFVEIYAAGREKLNDREVNVVRTRVRTSGTVQATLFDFDYNGTTFLSAETDLPVRAERFLNDGGKAIEVRHDFAENQTAADSNVHDLISALYHLRRFDFSNNATKTVKIWENERLVSAKLQVAERETVSTAIGAMNALVVRVRTDDDNLNRYKAKIYLSDDERRLPVLISFRLANGEVRAELASAQIIAPETVAAATVVEPIPQATPITRPTPRPPAPQPTPKPYVENQPLDSDLPFALGEKLTFEVSRGAQKIGVVQLQAKERKQFSGRDSVLLSATAQSSGSPAVFAPTDKIESYIDPNYLVPFRQEIRLSGALAAFNQTLNFDQERGATTNDKGLRVETPIGTHDVLSFIYALRAFRFSVAQNDTQGTRTAVFLGNAPVIITLKQTRGTIDFGGKKVNSLSLTMSTGNPQIDSLNFRLWLSDDARRLPLKLTFNSPLGAVQADLIGSSNNSKTLMKM